MISPTAPQHGGHYFLGLPAWAFPGWKNRYFIDAPSRLASYASVFNAVEGNTTFYALPTADTADRLAREAALQRTHGLEVETLDPALNPQEIALERIDNAGLDSVMTNSFGFGGTNGSMILSKYLD